jgi:tetratricopeptide (TPR) repeat protein
VKSVICIALLTLLRAEASDTPPVWSDWASEGSALAKAGNYSEAAQAFRRALAIAEDSDLGNRRLIGIYDALALVYAEAGQYAESEHEYRRALDLTVKILGRQSLEYALLAARMAMLPTQIGNRDSEIALLREAIVVNGSTGAGAVRELTIVRVCLAQILMDERRYAEAESVFLDAQANFAGLKTTDPELLAEMFGGLGVLRFHQGRYDESAGLYRQSLRLLEDTLGDEHPSLVVSLNDLALSYLKLGRLDGAELTLRRAMAICSKTLGENHPAYSALLANYAVVLRKLGRKREAKAFAARSQQFARASRSRNGVGSTINVNALRSERN